MTAARLKQIAAKMQQTTIDHSDIESEVDICVYVEKHFGENLTLPQAKRLRELYENGPRNQVIVTGERPTGDVRLVTTRRIVGKTVVAVAQSVVDSSNGDEPSTILFFDDNTMCVFVHPRDEE